MMYGFAKRIEELEKQISNWETKARKEDKWKKSLETWLLRNFDFDIQEDLTKFSDSTPTPVDDDDLIDEDRSDYPLRAISYEEPPVINYNNNSFPLGQKQVYNNPHLIIESQFYNNTAAIHSRSEDLVVNGLQYSKNVLNNSNTANTKIHNPRIVENESSLYNNNNNNKSQLQQQQQQQLLLKPAHSNSQKPHTSLQLSSASSSSSYDNNSNNHNNNSNSSKSSSKHSSSNNNNNNSNKVERSEQRRKSISLNSDRKSATSTPVSLQKIDPNVISSSNNINNKNSQNSTHNIVGSNITLTPLPLLSSSSLLNSSQIIGGCGQLTTDSNESSVKNSAHYNISNTTSNNLINNIRHNVTSLLNITSSQSLKREVQDLQDDHEQQQQQGGGRDGEEWQEDEDYNTLTYFKSGQLKVERRNVNHEGSSDGRNSSVDLDMSCEDMEEVSMVDTEDQNQNRVNSAGSSTGDINNIFKGGTGSFFSNHPKNGSPQAARKAETVCNFCCKSYSSQTYLKTHIDVVHKGMKAFRCKLCGVSFGFKSDLTRHLRSHLKSGQRKANVV